MSDALRYLTHQPHVLTSQLDDETVLFNLHTEHYYSLDRYGTRIWELLGELGSAEAVVSRLADEFEADLTALRFDVSALVDGLLDAGLVAVAP